MSAKRSINTIQNLEMFPQPEETPDLSQSLEEDIDKLFEQIYIRNRPDANFRAIALARVSGKNWE